MNNLTRYKKALIYVKELGKLESEMLTAISKLEPYKKYIPAAEAIDVLNNGLNTVRTHLKHQQKIVESKGSK